MATTQESAEYHGGEGKINRNRDELAELAESDNPAAWVAEALLEAAE